MGVKLGSGIFKKPPERQIKSILTVEDHPENLADPGVVTHFSTMQPHLHKQELHGAFIRRRTVPSTRSTDRNQKTPSELKTLNFG